MKKNFTLGEKVTFTKTLFREHGSGGRRSWRTYDFKQEPKAGIITGWRTLSNGIAVFGYEEPTEWKPESFVKAYLVTTDMRKKAVYVLPEDLTADIECSKL